MKRLIDIGLALVMLVFSIVPILVIAVVIRCTSKGPALYWSDRIGRNNRVFRMPKFRSMRVGTPEIATHLLREPDSFVTPVGKILRRTSLDELPQLFSVMRGDMSFVGPRPALFNQDDLIAMRTAAGVHRLAPGITGWAQVNGRDRLSIPEKVGLEIDYLNRQSFWFDLKILRQTITTVMRREGVSH